MTSHSISHTYYTNTDALEYSVHGNGNGGDVEYQQEGADDYRDGRERQRELQPGARAGAGNDHVLNDSAEQHGKIYGDADNPPPCQGPYGTGCSYYTAAALLAQDLADVSWQDVKSGVYRDAAGCDAADDR